MLKCKINNQEVEVEEGATIMEAFSQSGQDIAHYCWHPGLSVAGSCRLCLVEIEENPKLQIACNTKVTEGMVISNQTKAVKEAVKWGLNFHLVNHPLDCPICDQAGECGLQEQYMKYGNYDSSFSEKKNTKAKVVDLGKKIVLDQERCILCSRCTRFTDEVSKSHELGIFNRGDHSEVDVVKGKKLENDYALNTVDLCPVGALTSKDFRFKQRVWYLKNTETTCPGCSTGCSVKVYHNKEGLFRIEPCEDVTNNAYWMCDEGREAYKYVNKEERLLRASEKRGLRQQSKKVEDVIQSFAKETFKNISLVITAQNTNEDYQILKEKWPDAKAYYWKNNKETFNEFDGLLKRGDKNPNTAGLLKNFPDIELLENFQEGELTVLLLPENKKVYPDLNKVLKKLNELKNILVFSSFDISLDNFSVDKAWLIPTKTFIERSGTYLNFQGKERKVIKGLEVVSEACSLEDFFKILENKGFLVHDHASTTKENIFLKEDF